MNNEDREAARHLVGYCEKCGEWTHFNTIDRAKGCDQCHGQFSMRHGYQITTERTFNPLLTRKRLTKAESRA